MGNTSFKMVMRSASLTVFGLSAVLQYARSYAGLFFSFVGPALNTQVLTRFAFRRLEKETHDPFAFEVGGSAASCLSFIGQ